MNQLGQCGIGQAIWEQYCAEHVIDVTGKKPKSEDHSFLCFHEETGAVQFVPRNLMVDLEPNERQSGGEWTFSCQHGAQECNGNMVETCFINLAAFKQDDFMDFILAYEAALSKNSRDAYSTAKTVYDAGSYSAVTWADLNACMGSSGAQGSKQGNAWEHQMALWTNAANHQYTPWITLNGKHTSVIQNECTASTLQCTCAQYKGTNSCCSKFKEDKPDGVCYKNEKPRLIKGD